MPIPELCPCAGTGVDGHSTYADCDFGGEIEDECDTYMNDKHGVDGAFWGRSEAGDWGLWECEE
jgi:hypothetical protein